MTKARTLADNFAADINGITAGTGITGGGTSGTVTVTNSMATAIDAKGDLVVGTGSDTFSRLAVASTAGYLLSVDSAESTGLKWAAPAAGGKVLQVIQGTDTTVTTITSTSYVTTGLSATITPSSASSKVLIMFTVPINTYRANNEGAEVFLSIYDGSSHIFENRGPVFRVAGVTLTANRSLSSNTGSYLHSPNTTSAKTYTIYGKIDADNSNSAEFNAPSTGFTSTIILMEIGA